MVVLDNKKEEVLDELIRKYDLYKKQVISYKEDDGNKEPCFKEMYEEYKEQYTEKEFASILYISEVNFRTGLKAKNRATILTNRTIQDDVEKLKKELIERYKLAENYSNFMEIYQEFKTYFTEIELAEFLGIKKRAYQYMRAKSLKSQEPKIEKKINMEIIQKLGTKYNLYKGQRIAYEHKDDEEYEGPYFKEMYEEYKDQYSELEFAEILGLSKESFKSDLIYGGKKLRILKNIILEKEEKDSILEEIIKKYNLYKGQKINYEQFYVMYETYKLKLTGIEFAELLGISQESFYAIKTRNPRILMNRELTEDQKQIALENIILKYDLYKKQQIKYEYQEGDEQWYNGPYFKEMHEEYKSYFTIIEFANLLQIYNNGETLAIKYNGKCSMILTKRELNEEDKNNLNKIVSEYEGVSIPYEDNEKLSFKILYAPYKSKVTEREFTNYIGISVRSLESMKFEKRNRGYSC